jgi:TAT (twin-arginine translocation) pathway-exported protein
MKLDRRQFLEGAAALGAAPLLGPFEPALAAPLPAPTTLNKVPVLIPIYGTSEAFAAPPWLVRMICAYSLACSEARLYGLSYNGHGPYRREIANYGRIAKKHSEPAKIKAGIAANSLDAIGIWHDTDIKTGRSRLVYKPRAWRYNGRYVTFLGCPGPKPLTPEQRAELQPLEQELAELAGDDPPRYSPLR